MCLVDGCTARPRLTRVFMHDGTGYVKHSPFCSLVLLSAVLSTWILHVLECRIDVALLYHVGSYIERLYHVALLCAHQICTVLVLV